MRVKIRYTQEKRERAHLVSDFSLFLGETEDSLHPGKERACPSFSISLSCLTFPLSWVKRMVSFTQEKRERQIPLPIQITMHIEKF